MPGKADALGILREAYDSYSKIFPCGVHDAFLYGSYARGDHHAESDVDILLTVDMSWEEISRYRQELARASSELSLAHDVTVSVSVNPLDVFTGHPELPYYKNVRAEGIRYGA